MRHRKPLADRLAKDKHRELKNIRKRPDEKTPPELLEILDELL